jgi:DNA invertase Pin-like site-specific DNA recombinase
MMKLGYARVSTDEQDTAAQVSALKSRAAEKYSLRRPQEENGTGPTCIAFWINFGKAT